MNPFDLIKEPVLIVKESLTIQIQAPGLSYKRLKNFAERFGCSVYKTKDKEYFTITSHDPVNFFWLGMNMNNAMINDLSPSFISKYVEP